jgi:tetratricopeptide (TPR) repeat protein
MKQLLIAALACFFGLFLSMQSCQQKKNLPSPESLSALQLKKGQIVSCGPEETQLGKVAFAVTGSEKVNKDFNLGLSFLHSFEYDEAEKIFARIIAEDPGCAMAYWGVAMSNYHPLWTVPSQAELEKGYKAIEIAQTLPQKTKKEAGYIEAIAAFYKDFAIDDHRTRTIRFEKAMEQLYKKFPADTEASIFYALALTASADPADKTFSNQKKAGNILNALYPGEPNHPGIVHYIIHTYDYPELASLALSAARKYAAIAPSSAHAQHMPSHIFTRLGLWDECISANLAATASAKCYAEQAQLKGHWDEELHGMDYLVYAYLQQAANEKAMALWKYLQSIKEVYPLNFKVAYAYAAIPSRYLLENKSWKEAAVMPLHPGDFPWQNFPWQKAIIHFTRALGSVHTNNLPAARAEVEQLTALHDTLFNQKDWYKATAVQIQLTTARAWILFKEGKEQEALQLMNLATDLEDKTEKHPVTPGEVIPAKELLADMLLAMNKPAAALEIYKANLKKHPNRFNAVYGAAVASHKAEDIKGTTYYYRQLLALTKGTGASRPELKTAGEFLKNIK